MPKKESKKEKILKEIADELRESEDRETPDEGVEEESEKSGLEEDVNFSSMEFQQFMQPSEETSAPVLERIAGSQPKPIFVGGIPQTLQTIPGEEKESDDVKYVPGHEGNNEPKYVEENLEISRRPDRIDFMKVGREPIMPTPKIEQERFFRHSEFFPQIESSTPEKRWAAERIDFSRAGREDPFEKEKEKYEKYKPKMPKGS